MTSISRLTEDLAIVTETPSWLRRVFLGEDVESRFVVRDWFGWRWETTGRLVVDVELLGELDGGGGE